MWFLILLAAIGALAIGCAGLQRAAATWQPPPRRSAVVRLPTAEYAIRATPADHLAPINDRLPVPIYSITTAAERRGWPG